MEEGGGEVATYSGLWLKAGEKQVSNRLSAECLSEEKEGIQASER
jgi:hypothetical protein